MMLDSSGMGNEESPFKRVADRELASQVDDEFAEYVSSIPDDSDSSEDVSNMSPEEIAHRISKEDTAIIDSIEVAQQRRQLDALFNPEPSAAEEIIKGAGKGVFKALENTANFVIDASDAFDNFLQKNGFTEVDIIEDGTKIDVVSRIFAEPKNPAEKTGYLLGQYIAPFAAISKVVKGAGLVANAKRIGLSSVLSGLIADPEDGRLADLIQAEPRLANPIAELLSNEDGDSRLDGRIKTAIEAALVDTVSLGVFGAGEALYTGVKAVRELRKSRKVLSSAKEGVDGAAGGTVKGEAELAEAEAKMAKDLKPEVEVRGEIAQAGAASEADQALVKRIEESNKRYGDGPVGGGPKGPDEPQGSSINLPEEKITNMPDLLAYLKKHGRTMEPEDMHMLAKRGLISDEANLRLSKQIFEQNDKSVDEFFAREFGESLNQEQLTLMKMGYKQKQLELENVLLGIDPDNIDEATSVLLLDRVNEFRAYKASIKAGFSESGRALRSSKKYMQDLAESGADTRKKAGAVKEYLKLLEGGDDVADIARNLQRLRDRGTSLYESFEYLDKTFRKKTGDALHEMWVNNILSGPNTLLMVNPISNIFQTGVSTGSALATRAYKALRYPKAQLKQIQAALQPKTMGQYYTQAMKKQLMDGEMYIHATSLIEGIQDGHRYFFESMGGKNPKLPSQAGGRQSKGDTKREQFMLGRKKAVSSDAFNLNPEGMIGKYLDIFGEAINTPSKILTAQDLAFNSMHQRVRMNVLAHRSALSKGLDAGTESYAKYVDDFKTNPSEGTLRELERYGQEHTLTTPIDEGGSIKKAMGDLQTFMQSDNIPFGAGKYAGAFMRVGTNLVDRGVQYSPFGFLRKETRDNLFSGITVRREEELGKQLFGTGIVFGGGLLAYNGFITGSGPDDPKMRRALRSSGFQQYSVKLPGGGYIPLDLLGPMAIPLKMSADIAELVGAVDESDADKAGAADQLMGAGGHLLAEYFTPEYLTRGVPEFFSLIKDVAEGREDANSLTKALAKFSTGFIPFSAALRTVGQTWDPEYRDTTPEAGMGVMGKMWDRVKGEWLETFGLAGYAGFPPELNIFGEEVTPPIGIGRTFLSPIFSNNPNNNDPLIGELVRLNMTDSLLNVEGDDVGENLSIRMVERTKRSGIAGTTVPVKLSPQEYHDYVKLAAGLEVEGLSVMGGKTLRDSWNELLETDMYAQASDELRKVMIKDVFRGYKSTAWKLQQLRGDIAPRIMENKVRKMDKLTSGRKKKDKAFGREM